MTVREAMNIINGALDSLYEFYDNNADSVFEDISAAHAVQAEYICDVIFGMNDSDIYYAEDYLSNNGWIKATTSFMWDICYYSALCNSTMPQAQFDALWDWCQFHHQDFPEGIEVV